MGKIIQIGYFIRLDKSDIMGYRPYDIEQQYKMDIFMNIFSGRRNIFSRRMKIHYKLEIILRCKKNEFIDFGVGMEASKSRNEALEYLDQEMRDKN